MILCNIVQTHIEGFARVSRIRFRSNFCLWPASSALCTACVLCRLLVGVGTLWHE